MAMDQSISNFSEILKNLNINLFLILASFTLLTLISLAVIYISYISWKDKRRIQ